MLGKIHALQPAGEKYVAGTGFTGGLCHCFMCFQHIRISQGHSGYRDHGAYKLQLTSNVTICLAMALSTASYICVFWIPKPQKMTKASRNCSSLRLKGLTLPVFSSILFTSWQTPVAIEEIGHMLLQ